MPTMSNLDNIQVRSNVKLRMCSLLNAVPMLFMGK